MSETAERLARETIIMDSHIDVPYRLQNRYENVAAATESGDFDYPRARAGGLDAPFMSIYIPAELEEKGGARELADSLIDMVEEIVARNPDKFALAYSSEAVRRNFAGGLISLPMGMENGSAIEGKLENLKHFYQRGIRYITLAHSKSNHISDSSYDQNRQWHGLSEFGKRLVVEMNNLGVMVDVSHISDVAFYQVLEISKVPVIASHSSARHFTPGWERNLTDDMIARLAENGGVIQINLGSSFINDASRIAGQAERGARAAYFKESGTEATSENEDAFTRKYRETHPYPFASLKNVLDVFDHVIGIAGVDHAGIGSDYDGVGDSLPEGLKDVASYPNLIRGLMERGYSEEDVRKILSANLLRVWSEVEEYAKAPSAARSYSR
ncbi:MAG: dipeptidase [Sphingomonadales bacterium]